ncbi:MAG: leucine-rich repeat domain-containing protein [Microscillaceae bacterium]|nr:leucine-rich repeat domain-containing protein [Microscillaceae bacterium]
MWMYSLGEALQKPDAAQFLRIDYAEEKQGWASLTQLPFLRHLHVCNFPSEAFGAEWPALPQLETLQIEKALLTALPPAFLQCPQLRACTILETPLQCLPAQIRQWKSLEKLQIQQTDLSCLPEEITHLTQLKVLDVAHNQLTYLPASLHKLRHLNNLAIEIMP